MNAVWMKALLVAVCWLEVTSAYAALPPTGQLVSSESTASVDQAPGDVAWSQIAVVVAAIVLVLLVIVLIGGFLVVAAENETPEQKLQRKRDQQEIANLARAAGIAYVMTEAMKKLK